MTKIPHLLGALIIGFFHTEERAKAAAGREKARQKRVAGGTVETPKATDYKLPREIQF